MKRIPLAAAVIAAALLTGCGADVLLGHPGQRHQDRTVLEPARRPRHLAPAVPAHRPADRPAVPAHRPASGTAYRRTGGARRGRPAADPRPAQHGLGRVPRRDAGPVAGRDHRERPNLALPAFFPLAAYQQVKAIYDPAADWHGRFWYDFTLDVGAAHRLVDPDARLVRVIVPTSDAAWVDPGVCANSLGYWHVPGARVVYREHGQERSFGIASLISWRGVWYVVHFGAVLRSVVTGIVDQPAAGPGVPGPAGGC